MSMRPAIPAVLLVMTCAFLPPLAAQQENGPRVEEPSPGPRAPAAFPRYQPQLATRDSTAGTVLAQDRTTITISTVALVAIIVLLLILIAD
ncbi:MAG: hypothetical protein ACREMN_01040 [Gemmatimonadales bacterium]